jgi:hypothetical protein
LVFCAGAVAVLNKQAKVWLGVWCGAKIRCKVKVLGAKVWCCV